MKRRDQYELVSEMRRLMQEHINSLEGQAFVPPDKEQEEADKKRSELIRKVTAEYLAEIQGPESQTEGDNMTKKPSVTLPGRVEKVIEQGADEPEKVQISINNADPLYREIRIENSLKDSTREEIHLQKDEEFDVTVEAEGPSITDEKNSKTKQRRTA